jgi:hypothetical protein
MSPRIVNKSRHYFYVLTALAGMALLYWCAPAYGLTFIPMRYVLLIIAVTAVITTLLTLHQFRLAYDFNSNIALLLTACWGILSWGFICVSVFLFSNYYLSGGSKHRKEFAIIERSEHPGNKGERENLRPAFSIVYRGLEKELVFDHRFYKWKDDYKTVILTLQEGKWGFEVIKGKAVTK